MNIGSSKQYGQQHTYQALENVGDSTIIGNDIIQEMNNSDNNKSHVKLLVCDDSSMNRKMLIRLVKKHFSNIIEAENGLEAVELL